MFRAPGGAAGAVLRADPGRGGAKPDPRTGDGRGETDDVAELVLLDEEEALDAAARSRARRIAARLSLPRPRDVRERWRGVGRPRTVRYREGAEELDLDRTLDVLVEDPFPRDDDVYVRERVRPARAVVLAVDVSGSMKGERVRTAAATVGALAGELRRDALGVIAFWSDAAVLLRPGDPVRSTALLDALLRIPARGLTNVAFPLQLAAEQLSGNGIRDSRVILLSDCVHNAGPDPRIAARRLLRLDVLLDASGERDVELGRDLAAAGRGALRVVRSYRDVAEAVSDIFFRG